MRKHMETSLKIRGLLPYGQSLHGIEVSLLCGAATSLQRCARAIPQAYAQKVAQEPMVAVNMAFEDVAGAVSAGSW